MNTDKTLADVQPGGRVRLGDGLRPCPFCGHSDFDQWPCEYIDASGANVVRCARCHAAAPMKVWHALSAQPSPGATALGIPIVVDSTVPPDTFEVRRPSPGGQGDAPRCFVSLDMLAGSRHKFGEVFDHPQGSFVRYEDHVRALAASQPVTMDDALAAGDGTLHGAIDHWQERALRAEAELAARQPVGEPVGTVHSGKYASGMPWCEVEWHIPQPAGTKLYTAQAAQAVDLGNVIEQIAQQWDGCNYDAVGETIDVGQAIRAAGKRLIDSKAVGK